MGESRRLPSGQAWNDLRMQTLGTGGRKSKRQRRFERTTKKMVQTLARKSLPAEDLASEIRGLMNNKHGPEWHCIVGEDLVVDVRYWRAKCFVFEGNGLKMMVFQSAPTAPETPPPRDESVRPRVIDEGSKPGIETDGTTRTNRMRNIDYAVLVPRRYVYPAETVDQTDECVGALGAGSWDGTNLRAVNEEFVRGWRSCFPDRRWIQVLESDMEEAYRERVLGMAVAAAKSVGKSEGVSGVVSALKASLTETVGPVWHVAGAKWSGEWGCSVAYEAGQMLEFRLGGHRLVVWKHAQALRSIPTLSMERLPSLLFVATFFLLVVYVRFQGSCQVCCSSNEAQRSRAQCKAVESAGEPEESGSRCSQGEIEGADQCLRIASVLFTLSCGSLATATFLKWSSRNGSGK